MSWCVCVSEDFLPILKKRKKIFFLARFKQTLQNGPSRKNVHTAVTAVAVAETVRLQRSETVKRMFARKVETKQTVLYPGDLAMANRYVYCYRPLYNIAKGTNANERLGSSISNVNVRMALAYTHLGLNSTGDTRLSTGSLFRVMVVKSLRDLSGVATSATVWSSITASAPGDNLHLISDSRQPASSLLIRLRILTCKTVLASCQQSYDRTY